MVDSRFGQHFFRPKNIFFAQKWTGNFQDFDMFEQFSRFWYFEIYEKKYGGFKKIFT